MLAKAIAANHIQTTVCCALHCEAMQFRTFLVRFCAHSCSGWVLVAALGEAGARVLPDEHHLISLPLSLLARPSLCSWWCSQVHERCGDGHARRRTAEVLGYVVVIHQFEQLKRAKAWLSGSVAPSPATRRTSRRTRVDLVEAEGTTAPIRVWLSGDASANTITRHRRELQFFVGDQVSRVDIRGLL